MLLSEINRYFIDNKRACLADLVNHFGADQDAILSMLDMLAAKGRITRVSSGVNCGGCARCDPARLVIYELKNHR
jgi:hypothetical protein